MRMIFIGLLATLSLSPSGRADSPPETTKKTVDHTNPEPVLDAIFLAARTSNATLLSGLCDPKGENDGDTKTLCNLTEESPKWTEFKRFFAKGVRISPVARIRGDRAKLNFLFGPDGRKPEEMNLIRRNGLWYLLSY